MSWPAACAIGPSWPKPVMRPYTSRGLRFRHASGPRPRRSITPGRKPSVSTSAFSISFSTSSTPSGFFRSTPMLRRPRANTSLDGLSGSVPRTAAERSMRITSAPRSASIIAQNGPGPMPVISTTLMPERGPAIRVSPARARCQRGSVGAWYSGRRASSATELAIPAESALDPARLSRRFLRSAPACEQRHERNSAEVKSFPPGRRKTSGRRRRVTRDTRASGRRR